MIRAFVGLPLPGPVVSRLEAAQAGLPQGRPVPPENFHITLAFLGEQPGPVLEDVHYGLETIRAPGFELAIDGLGLFGGARPTTLYASVTPVPELSRLRDKVLRVGREAGIDLPASRFVPHVTLARFGQGLKGEAAAEVQHFVAGRLALATPPFAVGEFVLYRSHLGSRGAAYEEMAGYPLG